jgi:hypothetical protein
MADGKILYQSNDMHPGEDAVSVDANVTGIQQIQIVFNAVHGRYPVFANPKLY